MQELLPPMRGSAKGEDTTLIEDVKVHAHTHRYSHVDQKVNKICNQLIRVVSQDTSTRNTLHSVLYLMFTYARLEALVAVRTLGPVPPVKPKGENLVGARGPAERRRADALAISSPGPEIKQSCRLKVPTYLLLLLVHRERNLRYLRAAHERGLVSASCLRPSLPSVRTTVTMSAPFFVLAYMPSSIIPPQERQYLILNERRDST